MPNINLKDFTTAAAQLQEAMVALLNAKKSIEQTAAAADAIAKVAGLEHKDIEKIINLSIIFYLVKFLLKKDSNYKFLWCFLIFKTFKN